MRKLLSVVALFVLCVLSISMVAAFENGEVDILRIEVNDVEFEDLALRGNTADVDSRTGLIVEEGETLDIRVLVESFVHAEDIQVEAEIRGYEYDDYERLTDRTHVRDLEGAANASARRNVHLSLDLPAQLEDDRYLLRITVEDKDSVSVVENIVLQIEPPRHGVDIASVVFSPYGSTIEAGRSLLANVLLRNYGDNDEKDVQVTATIPALGVQAYESVDLVRTDNRNVDYEDVSELWLPIPATAAAGEYQVVVKARYDDMREVNTQTYTVTVLENSRFTQQDDANTLVLAVGPESQNVAAGQTATYAVALTNAGTTSKAYTVQAVSGDWATVSVSEPLVVLGAGQNKVVYVDVAASQTAVAGAQSVSVSISADNEMLKTVNLQSNVVAGSSNASGLRNGLEIALIVLVVLLVIVGLIIGFSRLRRDDEEEQTYY